MTEEFDLGIIGDAPTAPSGKSPSSPNPEAELQELRHQKTILEDEVDRLKKEISVESQKARLLIPYANKVFVFCVIYTGVSFLMLFCHGAARIPFSLDTSTMNFVAGSNLASVIGLLGIVAGGLFRSK